jgi:pimeloyl-ACP methyl ester carboxylesterase
MSPDSTVAPSGGVTTLLHGRISLALHQLRVGVDHRAPLLLLHGLGARTPDTVPADIDAAWTGPIYGLDFTGHGQSGNPVGGGYSAEVLMGDADTALRHIGPAFIVGAGLGGYVALLTAGAAPNRVLGVVVTGGTGLSGGGVRPGSELLAVPAARVDGTTPDPFALLELASDVRPPNYVASFVRQFVSASSLDQPVAISTAARPPWLAAVVEEFGVGVMDLDDALDSFSRYEKPAT